MIVMYKVFDAAVLDATKFHNDASICAQQSS